MLRNNKVLSGSFLCSIAAIAPGPGAELFHSANILRVNDTPSPETREKKLFKKLPLQDELLQREGRHHRLRAGREELGHDICIGGEPGKKPLPFYPHPPKFSPVTFPTFQKKSIFMLFLKKF